MSAGKRRALIIGIGGQDGSYLADLLLEKGYVVHGVARRSSVDNLARVRHVLGRIVVHRGDLADDGSIRRVLEIVHPDEVYNEADQDEVGYSFDAPAYSSDITGAAVGRLLQSVLDTVPDARVFQPLSSTVFGPDGPRWCSEAAAFDPRSPYACAKVYAYHLCRYYRRQGVKVSTAFFFNHDSPRRGPNYLLQKIAWWAVRYERGDRSPPDVTDVGHRVDIGHARDYVRAAYLINTYERADDWVIGTGGLLSINEWLLTAEKVLGVTFPPELWQKPCGDESPGGVGANSTKALNELGWKPIVTPLELMSELIRHHREEAARATSDRR